MKIQEQSFCEGGVERSHETRLIRPAGLLQSAFFSGCKTAFLMEKLWKYFEQFILLSSEK